jgi:hypothetical protein
MATDWGARILSDRSALYDPLSYHYGSVWPLFTGWTAMGAYHHGRPHVAFQALMANALLTYTGALGYVTELLSGDFATPFGRSSHHQIWSEAMVVTPALRGLLGIDTGDAGRTLRFAPALPATWDRVEARAVRAGAAQYDLTFERGPGRAVARIASRGESTSGGVTRRLVVAPAFPLDARVRRVTVNNAAAKYEITRVGDVQRIEVTVDAAAPATEVAFSYDEGTDVYAEPHAAQPGAANEGVRLLRVRPEAAALHLTIEGRGGRAYAIAVRSPRRLGKADEVTLLGRTATLQRLEVRFSGPADQYVRRELMIPFVQ